MLLVGARGAYHERLAAWLRAVIATGQYTQESVAKVVGKHQTVAVDG